jgi:hypothetical protein
VDNPVLLTENDTGTSCPVFTATQCFQTYKTHPAYCPRWKKVQSKVVQRTQKANAQREKFVRTTPCDCDNCDIINYCGVNISTEPGNWMRYRCCAHMCLIRKKERMRETSSVKGPPLLKHGTHPNYLSNLCCCHDNQHLGFGHAAWFCL